MSKVVQTNDMIGQPLVTVVIPTYNHAEFLKRALDSVVAQTYKDWEAIVVNNFSTDNTIVIVESFNDERIRLINFRNNGIIAASRNRGIEAARGKYVAFLDSDDIWYPEKLQVCLDQAETGAQLICHGELWVNTDNSRREVMYGPAKRAKYQSLLFRGNCISTSATFITTQLLRSVSGFDESDQIVTAEDYDLWLRLAETKPKTVFVPQILGEFHRLKNSASSAVLRNLASETTVLQKHFALQPKTIFTKLKIRHRFAIANYGAARQLSNQPRRALVLFFTAIRLSPIFIRSYPGLIILAKRTLFKSTES
ncbi:MAG: glycosyltransferase family 2 protein [Ilumatobacteraceae bacterium]|jgi:teichuronic acid biosynthesis glycosyltransferase TuaG